MKTYVSYLFFVVFDAIFMSVFIFCVINVMCTVAFTKDEDITTFKIQNILKGHTTQSCPKVSPLDIILDQ